MDKPKGITSARAVALVKRHLPKKTKIGHTGTLDPLASGLLVLLIGRASRLSRYVTGLDKTYTATAQFGSVSSTLDAEGEISYLNASMPDEKDLREAIAGFTGDIEQVPPMASAVKVDGERLYDLHRKGITVERESRRVRIHAFDLTSYDRAAGTAAFDISCTSGTYVRTLISDLADSLENGAYLTDLRRNSVGNLDARNAAKIEDLNPETISNRIIQPTEAVRHLPVLEVGVRGRRDVVHGRSVDAAGFVGSFRVEDRDGLLAIYVGDGSVARPEVVLWAE